MPWVKIEDCVNNHPLVLEGEEKAGGFRNSNMRGHEHWLVIFSHCCVGHSERNLDIFESCTDGLDPCKDC